MRGLPREEADFRVVGAGAGGGVIGAKLAEAGFSVVITARTADRIVELARRVEAGG